MPSGDAWCYPNIVQAAQQIACVNIYDMVSGATVWECGYTGVATIQLRTVRKESGCAQTEVKQQISYVSTLSLSGMNSRFLAEMSHFFGTSPYFFTQKLNIFLAN